MGGGYFESEWWIYRVFAFVRWLAAFRGRDGCLLGVWGRIFVAGMGIRFSLHLAAIYDDIRSTQLVLILPLHIFLLVPFQLSDQTSLCTYQPIQSSTKIPPISLARLSMKVFEFSGKF